MLSLDNGKSRLKFFFALLALIFVLFISSPVIAFANEGNNEENNETTRVIILDKDNYCTDEEKQEIEKETGEISHSCFYVESVDSFYVESVDSAKERDASVDNTAEIVKEALEEQDEKEREREVRTIVGVIAIIAAFLLARVGLAMLR